MQPSHLKKSSLICHILLFKKCQDTEDSFSVLSTGIKEQRPNNSRLFVPSPHVSGLKNADYFKKKKLYDSGSVLLKQLRTLKNHAEMTHCKQILSQRRFTETILKAGWGTQPHKVIRYI